MSGRDFEVEVPVVFDAGDDARRYWASGTVRLGGRWPWVLRMRLTDIRTHEDIDLTDDTVHELVEEALIAEAQKYAARENIQ